MNNKKKIASYLFFILIMFLTFYTFLKGQNFVEIWDSIRHMKPLCMILATFLGLFFVSMEGVMIWYLLHSMQEKSSVLRCIQYSFIGFFYSGITPSATGGQPMQLYYMNKDGNKTSSSTVVLMTVAVMYKLVLVLMGIGILLVWWSPLKSYLGSYFYLYLLGLALNIMLVIFILAVMFYPVVINRIGAFIIRKLAGVHLVKQEEKWLGKLDSLIYGYTEAVTFLKTHGRILAVMFGLTFVQRCSVFVLTYVVYLGFSLQGNTAWQVMALQASVYIAVDMLPVPGSQGITELMYQAVFDTIFPAGLLTSSMLVTRGVNFYFLLIVSLLVIGYQRVRRHSCFGGKKRQNS